MAVVGEHAVETDGGREALTGKVPPRTNETTIFKSLGMAVEDVAAALLVYRAAISTL